MKQIVEIEVPEGYKAVYNKDTQKIEMLKSKIPKTWEEFCEDNPVKNGECFIYENEICDVFIGGGRGVEHKVILPDRETAEAFVALMQLIQLRDCYRNGWVPDWSKRFNKYCIIYHDNTIISHVSEYSSNVLSFQSEAIRDEFRENFKDLIIKAKNLI